jgi:serine/threonine protein kinase
VTISEELQRLASLRESGLLTDDEFHEAKRRVLSRPVAASGHDDDRLGAYHLVDKLGAGGMAVVYRGIHGSSAIARRQHGEVAIKVLHPHLVDEPLYRARFEREAEIGSRLDHPNIVQVHDLVIDGSRWALVLDLVEGPTLADLVDAAHGGLGFDTAMRWFHQLLDALEAAHGVGVVHRDLKPDNILVRDTDETVHICDFGIAAADEITRDTRTGARMGTFGYGAPEQFRDASRADARADLYAVGVMLFEMLTGAMPWPDEDWRRILHAQLQGPPDLSDVDEPVATALHALLQPDPDDRPADVAAVRALLDAHDAHDDALDLDIDDERDSGTVPDEALEDWALDLVRADAVDLEPDDAPPKRRGSAWLGLLGFLVATGIAGFVSYLLALSILSAPEPLWSPTPGPLVVAVGNAYRPMYWHDAKGETHGFDADLARELGRRLGTDGVVFHTSPSPLTAVRSGEADVAIAGLTITPERLQSFLFSNSYLPSTINVVTRPGAVARVNDAGPRLAGLTCTSSSQVFEAKLRQTACRFVEAKRGQSLTMVRERKADVTAVDGVVLTAVDDLEPVRVNLGTANFGVAMPPGSRDMKARIDAVLQQMQDDGTLSALKRRHGLAGP